MSKTSSFLGLESRVNLHRRGGDIKECSVLTGVQSRKSRSVGPSWPLFWHRAFFFESASPFSFFYPPALTLPPEKTGSIFPLRHYSPSTPGRVVSLDIFSGLYFPLTFLLIPYDVGQCLLGSGRASHDLLGFPASRTGPQRIQITKTTLSPLRTYAGLL